MNITKANRRLLLVHNPRAGNGRGGRLLADIEERFRSRGCDVDVYSTRRTGHAADLVRDAHLGDYDGIVAAGGDGTVHEVVTGYFRNPSRDGMPIGIIPNGTGNAFAREMGLLGSDWKKAVDAIVQGETRSVDVTRFETGGATYHSLNILGVGFVSDVTETSMGLKFLGNQAYLLATFWRLLGLRTYPLRLTVDGDEVDVDACFATVSNSRYTGTTFLIAPRAELDDGLLDLVVLKGISRLRVIQIFKTIFTGAHVQEPEVEYRQARRIRIEAKEPRVLNVDGELLGSTPVDIECLPRALRMFW